MPPTDGFRCSDCEAILYTPTALASGNCGLHPRKHDFTADENGDCQECGYPFAFGALHVEPEVPEPVELEPQVCRSCWHTPHEPDDCHHGQRIYTGAWRRCTCAVAA